MTFSSVKIAFVNSRYTSITQFSMNRKTSNQAGRSANLHMLSRETASSHASEKRKPFKVGLSRPLIVDAWLRGEVLDREGQNGVNAFYDSKRCVGHNGSVPSTGPGQAVIITLEAQRAKCRDIRNNNFPQEEKYDDPGFTRVGRSLRILGNRGQVSQEVVNQRQDLQGYNRYSELKREVRSHRPKFGQSNLSKVVESVKASGASNCIHREPDPKVGSSTPHQYSSDYSDLGLDDLQNLSARSESGDSISIDPSDEPVVPDAPEMGGSGLNYAHATRAVINEAKLMKGRNIIINSREWTSKEEFGPKADSVRPTVIMEDRDNPDNQIVEHHERRIFTVNFKKHTFDMVNFLGLWNLSRNSQLTMVFASHFGKYFRDEQIEVQLPSTLVDELRAYWAHKYRDAEGKEFLVSVAKCRKLCSEMRISAEQQALAIMFAPAIAYEESWELQQSVSRIVTGSYYESSIVKSYTISRRTLNRSFQARVFLCVGVAAIFVASVAGAVVVKRTNKYCDDNNVHPASYVWSLSSAIKNALMHALNGNIEIHPLRNCARLPQPKKLKKGASMRLCDGDVRKHIHFKRSEEQRGTQAVYGFNTKLYAPVAFASNEHNEEQALNARVMPDTLPAPRLDECIDWCKSNHRDLFPNMHKVHSVPFDEYLLRSNASPSVKLILERTYLKLESQGYDENSAFTKSQLHQMTTRSSFVKVENNLYWSPGGKKQKAPRIIQGGTPEFIVLVGPWIMALQDLLKRRWTTERSNLVFTSGVKSEEAASFIAQGDGEILEDDIGKFDSSVRREWCEYEVWICHRFGAPRAVLDLMAANIKTHGTTAHGWKYKCDGTRKSGDPYTSLMNTVINGLSHLFLYCSWTNRTVKEARITIRMLLQGDDNALRHVERIQFDWKVGMSSLGFDSEAVYRKHLSELEFCSNRLYLVDGGEWVFGPKPGRVLAKLGYIVNPPKLVSRESLMRGVALGLQRACNHIPPIRVVLERILDVTKGVKAYTPRKFLEHTMKMREIHECTVELELSLSDQYDWDHGKQRMFNDMVSRLNLGDSMDDPLCHLLYDRDTSGPQVIFNSVAAA